MSEHQPDQSVDDAMGQKTKLLAYEELIEVLQNEVTDLKNKVTVARGYVYITLKGLKSICEANTSICGKMAIEEVDQRILKLKKNSKSETIDIPLRVISEHVQNIQKFLQNSQVVKVRESGMKKSKSGTPCDGQRVIKLRKQSSGKPVKKQKQTSSYSPMAGSSKSPRSQNTPH